MAESGWKLAKVCGRICSDLAQKGQGAYASPSSTVCNSRGVDPPQAQGALDASPFGPPFSVFAHFHTSILRYIILHYTTVPGRFAVETIKWPTMTAFPLWTYNHSNISAVAAKSLFPIAFSFEPPSLAGLAGLGLVSPLSHRGKPSSAGETWVSEASKHVYFLVIIIVVIISVPAPIARCLGFANLVATVDSTRQCSPHGRPFNPSQAYHGTQSACMYICMYVSMSVSLMADQEQETVLSTVWLQPFFVSHVMGQASERVRLLNTSLMLELFMVHSNAKRESPPMSTDINMYPLLPFHVRVAAKLGCIFYISFSGVPHKVLIVHPPPPLSVRCKVCMGDMDVQKHMGGQCASLPAYPSHFSSTLTTKPPEQPWRISMSAC